MTLVLVIVGTWMALLAVAVLAGLVLGRAARSADDLSEVAYAEARHRRDLVRLRMLRRQASGGRSRDVCDTPASEPGRTARQR